MHSIAAFPSTTSPHFRASPSAPGRCRQAVRSITTLCSDLTDSELDRLGPTFVFIVWVASRNLIILWTAGHETGYGSIPSDLVTLLAVLRKTSTRWDCARSYAELIQFILDTKDRSSGAPGLSVFVDTKRTAYGIQNLLGSLAAENSTPRLDPLFDWLGLSTLEHDDLTMPGLGTQPIMFVQDENSDWILGTFAG